MATEQRTLVCSKEVLELGEETTNFVSAVKDALADGFQPGTDIPVFLAEALDHLVKAVQGVEEIPQELRDNPQEFVNGVFVGVSGLPFIFLEQK